MLRQYWKFSHANEVPSLGLERQEHSTRRDAVTRYVQDQTHASRSSLSQSNWLLIYSHDCHQADLPYVQFRAGPRDFLFISLLNVWAKVVKYHIVLVRSRNHDH